ncbi:MAG: M48 family metalloprotease [Candidatus Cloacimonadaceae bacterium]|nr:M48 family metalloprotease [Candidatus Cloacimonadaceae bacterium]MDP3114967.1 M48 family metalloprotease [Candidatus Cloacimonadaceae bacterium]
MRIQFRKSRRIIQYLSLIILLLPGMGYGQLIDDLLNAGTNTIKAVDSVLLDMTSVSDTEENQIGVELKKEILKKVKIEHSKKYDVVKILNKILPHCKRKAIKYEVIVVKDDVFNAYAVAGGKMFLNTGLLENLDNIDEVAFVLAHEMAHNELKHCINRIQHSYQAAKIQPLLGAIVQLAYITYKHPFSKEDERAADEYAVNLMQRAGYKKAGAISFFRNLGKHEQKWKDTNLQAVNDFVSTHPTAEERRKRIEKL